MEQSPINQFFNFIANNDSKTLHPGAVCTHILSTDSIIGCIGQANLEQNTSVTLDTKFHLASLSKQFTAFLLAEAIADQLCSLNDSIGYYIKELKYPAADCTLHQLLFHTSGIKDYQALSVYAGVRNGDSITTQDAFHWINAQDRLNFKAGTRFLYSNSGYVLIALALETIYNQSFAKIAESKIFKPLNMSSTGFVTNPYELVPNRANAYKKTLSGYIINNPNYGVIGATCLLSTANDMAKWLAIPFNDIFFAKASSVGYFKKGQLDNGTSIPYGFGWVHCEIKGQKYILHAGQDFGFNAMIIQNLDNSEGLFCASANSSGDLHNKVLEFLDIMSPDNQSFSMENQVSKPKPGYYINDSMIQFVSIEFDGMDIILHMNGAKNLKRLNSKRLQNAWQFSGALGHMMNLHVKNSEVLVLNTDWGNFKLNRIPVSNETIPDWSSCYYSDTLNSFLKIDKNDNDQYFITIGQRESVKLEFIQPDFAFFGSNWIQFKENKNGIVYLMLYNWRCAGVQFKQF